MVEWYVYDNRKRKLRKAKSSEIPRNIIDNSDISIRDGELVTPKKRGGKKRQKT